MAGKSLCKLSRGTGHGKLLLAAAAQRGRMDVNEKRAPADSDELRRRYADRQ